MPYSNLQSVTRPPLGLTAPLSVAEVCPTPAAGLVSALGGAEMCVSAALMVGVVDPTVTETGSASEKLALPL